MLPIAPDEISHQIIGASEVHRTLGGPGLLESIYETQVLTYLRLTGIKLGLLVNFGAPYEKDGVSR
ncbi:MAG TPA: GxxExxY protein, partial [Parachlamydiaceae bacterium]|nr:GxxExxY protein [Parachlamydiaceae bacterium]